VLRDHAVLNSPIPLDLKATKLIPVPAAWSSVIKDSEIEVLPLIDEPQPNAYPGWCTYVTEHNQVPELEPILGGVNAKTPTAGAVWRQGHLMHFGFEESPAQLNANGRALLVNSICYIAQFVEDRPNVDTPSVFYSKKRIMARDVIGRLAADPSRDLDRYLSAYLAPKLYDDLKGFSREELTTWFVKTEPYITIDDVGKFVIDLDAERLGLMPAKIEFFESVLAMLEQPDADHSTAKTLLKRYAPDGPAGEVTSADDSFVAEWRQWLRENRDYLFFSDSGGFRWYIDRLAKRKQVPTDGLRMQDRATKLTAPSPGEPSEQEPVSVQVTMLPSQVSPGETSSMVVQVTVARGWHIYGLQPQQRVAVPTQLEVKLPDGVELAGDWIADDAVADPASGGASIYRDQVVFRQRLRVTPSASQGEPTLAVKLIYQVCDDEICSPRQVQEHCTELRVR
jgi:hypothetical protein